MKEQQTYVGIAGIGYDIPTTRLTSERIAEISGLPVTVLTENIGMHRKTVADTDDHPTQMAIRAARHSLETARIDASEVNMVIYCGGSPTDYGLGFPAATIQAELGIVKSHAFELRSSCNGSNLGLHTCKSLLMNDPSLHTGLVVCAEKFSTILDYSDPQNWPVFHAAEGAAAAVVSKHVLSNRLLAYESLTDGRFAEFIMVKEGGTRYPSAAPGQQAVLRAQNQEIYAPLLETVYLSNYIQVIERVVEKSGLKMSDMDFAILNQNFEKLTLAILEQIGLTKDQTWWSISENGHMGSVDVLYGLAKAMESGRIGPGSRVLIVSSSLGFTWAASVLQFL